MFWLIGVYTIAIYIYIVCTVMEKRGISSVVYIAGYIQNKVMHNTEKALYLLLFSYFITKKLTVPLTY